MTSARVGNIFPSVPCCSVVQGKNIVLVTGGMCCVNGCLLLTLDWSCRSFDLCGRIVEYLRLPRFCFFLVLFWLRCMLLDSVMSEIDGLCIFFVSGTSSCTIVDAVTYSTK